MLRIIVHPDPRNPICKAPNEFGVPVIIGRGGRRVQTLGKRVLRVLKGGVVAQGFLTYTARELRARTGQQAALIMED